MINTLKQKLIDRISIFNNTFLELLNDNNYQESSMVIERLEHEGYEFPSNPAIQSIWVNNYLEQSFTFRLYDNYISDFEIKKNNSLNIFSFNDYKKKRNIENVEIHLMDGEIDEQYKKYLIKVLETIRSTEIVLILNGAKWLDIPFEWQGHK